MKLKILELSLIVELKKDKNPRGKVYIRRISDQVSTDDICFRPLAIVSVSSDFEGKPGDFSFRLIPPRPYQGFDFFVVDVTKMLRRGKNQIIATEAFPVADLDLPRGVWRLALDLAGIELREVSFVVDSFRSSELIDEEGALRPGALDRIESRSSLTLEELLDE